MTRCPRCAEDNPARARFCLGCGLPLEAAAPAAAAEERKLVTAVFVDLVGSTAHAERHDPEDVGARLRVYAGRVRAELERFGGTVEKFIGDAVVALFGAPIANEDDPERALRAAFAIRTAIAELNEADAWLALEVRIGVATGEALVRTHTAASSGEAMAMGDVMNTAARIQSAASPGSILVGRGTHDATQHAVEYAPREALSARGKAEPVPVWEAVRLKESPARRHSAAPFVGRLRELAVLDHLWRRVRDDGRPATAMVLAEAGTGKTRLLAAFSERTGAPVFWGRCLAYGEAGAYAPVAELLAAAGAERVVAEASAGEDGLRTVAASLDVVLGTGGTGPDEEAREITQGELRWGVRRALELVAGEPVVLAFEDLHWADPALVDLIRFLEEAESPFLILGSARPEVAETRPSLVARGDRRLVVSLPPLTSAESETLVDELLGGADRPEGLAPVVAAAAGNPLFLEETVRMLVGEGLLSGREPAGPVPVPPSLRSMIGARLDRLPDLQRHLALRAAVVGGSFWPGAVASLNGVVEDVEGALEALTLLDVAEERSTSTVRGEREFAFRHEVIREVAYSRLPKGLRAELHVRCADWISGRQERDEFVEIAAHHLERACHLVRELERSPVPAPVTAAVDALRAAAEKAERREGLREADSLYERALDLVDGEHAEIAVELRLRRGRALASLGNLEDACERFVSVAADAATLGRADLHGAALVGLGNALQKQGRGADARLPLADAITIAEATGDTRLEVRALFELAQLDNDFRGERALAVEELVRALALAAELDDRPLLAEGELRLGIFLVAAGELERSEEALSRSAQIGSQLGSRRDESRATFMRALTAYHRGRPEEAERLALDAQEWFERTGDSYFEIQNLGALATYALARGDAEEAERRLATALELAGPSGGWLVADLSAALAELLARIGRVDEAVAAVQDALALVPADDPSARATALVSGAYVAAVTGDRELARLRADEALEILVRLGDALGLERGRITLGEALGRVGERERASALLRLAGEECARMGATTLLAEAEIALSALEAGG
jgi:class 3 adenylate cyclase/tetratricopeptide (TPR) repeat protein